MAALPSGAGYPGSFYSPRYPEGTRGGVVSDAPCDTVLEALDQDHVIYLWSHGWGSPNDDGILWPNETDPLTAPEILAAAGDFSQARIVWFTACHSYEMHFAPSPHHSPCEAAAIKGAPSVVGYRGAVDGGATLVEFEDDVWTLLQNGAGAGEAINQTIDAWEAAGRRVKLEEAHIVDDPETPSFTEGILYNHLTQAIAPAFTVP